MRKFRIEECNNGFMVVVTEGKDEYLGRYVFTTADELMEWMKERMEHHD